MNFIELQIRSVNLLSRKNKILYVLGSGLQASLGLIDLIGVLISGIIGVVASNVLTGNQMPNLILEILSFFKLENKSPSSLIVILSIVALLFFLMKTILALYISKKLFRFLANQQSAISSKMFNYIINADYIWIRNKDPHQISTAMLAGISAATVNSLGQTMLIISESGLLVLFLVIIGIASPPLAIVTILYFSIVVFLLNMVVGKKVSKYNQNMSIVRIKAQAEIFNTIKLFREIRILQKSEWFRQKIDKLFNRHSRNLSDDIWIQQLPKYILEIALLLGASLLVGIGRITMTSQEMIYILAVYLAGVARIFPSLLRIQSSIFSLRAASFYSQMALDLFDSLKKTESSLNREQSLNQLQEANSRETLISVTGLSFKFADSDRYVLENLNFSISRGEKIAIIGSSGSGKSTLCDLILGLLSPTKGSVLIKGTDASIWIRAHRGRVSYLPQETILVEGTIRENICLGVNQDDIDEEELLKAVRDSNLLEASLDFPMGLETVIESDGVNLSGGQKQRIGIARALYTKPEILILDEATSSLDIYNEKSIIQSIDSLNSDITVISITHKVQNLNPSTRVLEISKNGISFDGKLSDLH
jgi:ABC-type bacteriocin/lantibiotic exporter with double-glycine peptidase domain